MTATARYLTAAAAILGGFVSGTEIDRHIVIYPAWRLLGPAAWAGFSRQADLGNGIFLYSGEAIGCFLLTIAAIIFIWRERQSQVPTPLFVAAGLEIAVLLFTAKAAPVMFGIGDTTDPANLAGAFNAFVFWDSWRGVAQVAAFIALVVALAASRRERRV
jgi:hypothetical protein